MQNGPVSQAQRIASIDVLRGFALLGILVVNVQLFAMIEATLFNPLAYGDMTGLNRVVWLVTAIVYDQKFMTIFSMLFGAGIALMADRRLAAGKPAAGVHYRRMFWLMLLGTLHGYVFWYGDILFLYGVCGMVVYPFRRLRARSLIPLAFLMIGVASALFVLSGLTAEFWPDEARLEMEQGFAPPPALVEEELRIYRSGWLGQMEHRAPTFFEFQTFLVLFWGLWRAGGLMLLGMALYRLRFFQAACSGRTYLWTALGMLAVGGPVVTYWAVGKLTATDFIRAFFLDIQLNYWGSVAISLGYAALVMWWCRSTFLPGLKQALGAVGQMALTNYLTHTVVCTTIFYGHGLGLFGKVERSGQFALVVGIWIVQLIVSPIWLRRFRFGPMEWVWRSLTYWQRQPMRRSGRSA